MKSGSYNVSHQLSATFQQSALTFQGNVPQTSGFYQSIASKWKPIFTFVTHTSPMAPNSIRNIINQLSHGGINYIGQQCIFAGQLSDSLKTET